ncbi:sigma-70 family RNA polymerase sigma factor [Streptomyces sp. NPDC048603]|uniref:sigma-70 family RNA polymerase sigma factor n=1 Tax=Streptomyces sp. NPDC048603 TaxID=3365577 RepID=UPI003713A479
MLRSPEATRDDAAPTSTPHSANQSYRADGPGRTSRRTAPRPAPRPAPRSADADAFLAALYARHGAVIRRFAARLLGGDWHRAEDILQEVAIRAWYHASELDPSAETVRPWLFAVVRNLVIDGFRARQARPVEAEVTDLAAVLPVTDDVDRTLTTQVVVDALRALPYFQREVLLHVHYMGRSVRQTAQVLGVPQGTVKSRTYYATRALRDALESRGIPAA